MSVLNLIKSHSVHFDGLGILALFKVYVPHVHPQAGPIVEHLVLDYEEVRVESLCVHVVGLVLICEIEQDLEFNMEYYTCMYVL